MEICKFCQKEFETIKKLKGHYGKCQKRIEYINSILTFDFLNNEYNIKNKTSNIIAKELNEKYNLEITAGTLIKKLKKFNFKTKTMSETYTPERILRQQETNLKKYGAINVFCKGTSIRKKFEKEWIEHGYINPFSREDVKEKIKKTCLERYGVDHYSKLKECYEKIKKTCLERYGVENAMQCKEFYDKCFKNRMQKHFSKPHRKIVEILKNWRGGCKNRIFNR